MLRSLFLASLMLFGSVGISTAAIMKSPNALHVYDAPRELLYSAHNDDYTVRVRTPGGPWRSLYEYRIRVDADTLRVGEAQVGPGPSLKRFRGRAFGRAFQVLHRSCHITLRLVGPIPKETPRTKGTAKRTRAAKAAPAGA